MLCLTRYENERVRLKLGSVEVWIRVQETRKRDGRVRLAFDAPREVVIEREELIAKEAKREASVDGA